MAYVIHSVNCFIQYTTFPSVDLLTHCSCCRPRQKIRALLVILPKVQVAGYPYIRMHLTYVALHKVTWCMVHRTCAETASVSRGTSHVSVVSTPLWWIFKNALYKASHSCKITCERSESARERRIALYKSNHYHS